MSVIDERLKEFATATQSRYIDAINKYGSGAKAAVALGIHKAGLNRAIAAVRRKAALHGYAPDFGMHKVAPAPFVVRGTSTLYDDLGNQKLQWVKTKLDDEQVERAMRAAIEALAEDVVRAKPAAAPKANADHLLTLYTLTDCHVGMRSWKPEAGEDWDLAIAERVLTGAFQQLIGSTPKAGTAFVSQLGDFLHYDSLNAVTPLHGNLLDADGRYEKVVRVAVRILRVIIDAALRKHQKVVVLMAEGNHDMASSVWLRHLFSLLYENEPRVEVIDSPLPYYSYQHGETMLAFHHGHSSKNEQLPGIFAAQFPRLWGNTTRRYCHTGHRHHVKEQEDGGMIVIQHPTMAARDSFAARGGMIADRTMTAITYHEKHGQVGRVTVTPEMLAGA